MQIPDEAIIQQIKPGAVLRIKRGNISSSLPHFYVVINQDPIEFDVITLVFTTRFEEREKAVEKHGYLKSSLVYVETETCGFLEKRSLIDCNSIVYYSINELLQRAKCGEWVLGEGGYVPQELLEKLREEAKKSPRIPSDIRQCI